MQIFLSVSIVSRPKFVVEGERVEIGEEEFCAFMNYEIFHGFSKVIWWNHTFHLNKFYQRIWVAVPKAVIVQANEQRRSHFIYYSPTGTYAPL